MTETTDPKALSTRALAEMDTRGVVPTPDNYELWYTVASGANPGLVREIEQIEERGETVDERRLEQLRKSHLAESGVEDAMLEMGTKIDGELSSVMQMLDTAARDTGDYGASLNNVSAALGSERSPAEMRTLVETLVTATRAMENRSRELEQRLQESKSEVTQLRDNMEQIRSESLTDQLTGLGNRRRFDDALKQMCGDAGKQDTPMVLVLGDIDHFKKFNDTYGHQTGDQVLKMVASCIRQHVKAPLMPARYGGEEFALLLPGLDLAQGVKVADTVRRTIESKELVKKSTGQNLGAVTMSFGAALYEPGEALCDLIKRADACLYSAKHNGRNRVMQEVSEELRKMAG